MKRFLLALALTIAGMPRAMALRPFDGTDAGVARQGPLEFKFGYLGLLRESSQTFLLAHALVAKLANCFRLNGYRPPAQA
jgi:hypothetical protein